MGDGALAEFASAVDAVQCAAEIQQAMAECNHALPEAERIAFRIGVNLGDVIVEGDDIYGDGVNVAARLEGLAEPGGVCISAKVHDEVRGIASNSASTTWASRRSRTSPGQSGSTRSSWPLPSSPADQVAPRRFPARRTGHRSSSWRSST
jgi:class 3 adenylate cyclase